MATFTKINQFVEDLAHKVHDCENDQFRVALTSVAPVATNSVLADLTEISYANLSARDITTTSSAQTSGTYKLTLQDLTLTASGVVAGFQYVVVYNDTPTSPADPLVGFYNYGSTVNMTNGQTFVINFDDAAGLFTIA